MLAKIIKSKEISLVSPQGRLDKVVTLYLNLIENKTCHNIIDKPKEQKTDTCHISLLTGEWWKRVRIQRSPIYIDSTQIRHGQGHLKR